MMLTQVQALALGLTCALLFAVLGGSLIEWSKCITGYLNKEKPDRVARSPQATVGLIDLLVTALALVMFFFLAAVSWRALGLPLNVKTSQTTPTSVARDELANSAESDSSSEAIESSDLPPPKPNGISQIQFIYSGFAMSAQLLCVVLMTFFIAGRTGCSLKKLGWRTDQIMGDVRAGFQCFLMMTPCILVMNGLLQNITQTPYEHPVQEMIKQYPWLLGIAFWQAAIVAPISEEFAFRVLLIGWFESIHFGRDKVFALMFGTTEGKSEQLIEHQVEVEEEPLLIDRSNPYGAPRAVVKLPQRVGLEDHESDVSYVCAPYKAPWWPTLFSGMLFGLAHFSYGVSWISLIVFGVVLGRLYQQRQSIIPVILVHVLFNAVNVLLLGLSLAIPKIGG